MKDTAIVTFTNDAFYSAFAARDVQAMASLWSSVVPISCIHPGWEPLFGRDAVLESWTAILTTPGSPAIRCTDTEVRVFGDVATVICYERVGEATLAATNLFIREHGAWKLYHHQAGETPSPAETASGNPPSLQ